MPLVSAVALAGMCRTDSKPFFPQAYHRSWASSPENILFTLRSSTAHQRPSYKVWGVPATVLHQLHLRMQEKDKKCCGWDVGLAAGRLWCCSSAGRDLPGAVGNFPAAPRSPSTLCFICLEHGAFWESSVCARPHAGQSAKQLRSHIRLLGTSEISTKINWLRQQRSPPFFIAAGRVANATQNLRSTFPDPKVPPSLTGAGSGRRALQLRQEGQQILTFVQIKARIHLTAVVSYGFLRLGVGRGGGMYMCVRACPRKQTGKKPCNVLVLGRRVFSVSMLPRGAAVLQPAESEGLRLRNLRDTSIHF